MTRPSDRAIAQALYELIETQGFLIGGTLNLVVERARELDATAALVVVGEDLWSLFLKHRDDISTNVLMVGTDDELTAAVRTAALAGDHTIE